MIILISGKQGSGKTALSDGIYETLNKTGRTKFAKVLYEMHDAVLSILNRHGFDISLDKSLLQLLGTDWGRKKIDDQIWIKCARSEISRINAAGLHNVIVDDCRFKNEFTAFDDTAVVKIRLECPEEVRKARCSQWRDNSTHQSEIDLDDWVDRFDLVIDTEHISKEDTLKQALEFINGKISQGSGV